MRVLRNNSSPATFVGQKHLPVTLFAELGPSFFENLSAEVSRGVSSFSCSLTTVEERPKTYKFVCKLSPTTKPDENTRAVAIHQRNAYGTPLSTSTTAREEARQLLRLTDAVLPFVRGTSTVVFFADTGVPMFDIEAEFRMKIGETRQELGAPTRTDSISKNHEYLRESGEKFDLVPGWNCPLEEYFVSETVASVYEEFKKWLKHVRFSYDLNLDKNAILGEMTINESADMSKFPGKRYLADALSNRSSDTTLFLRITFQHKELPEDVFDIDLPLISQHAALLPGPGRRTVQFAIMPLSNTDKDVDEVVKGKISLIKHRGDAVLLDLKTMLNYVTTSTAVVMASEQGFLIL